MSAAKNRLISIVIPVRNGGRPFASLLDRLGSLALPPGVSCETIVGYQDSSDDTLAIAQAANVRIVHCDATGPAHNRNRAAAAARGELLCFIDADACPVRDDFLLQMVAAAAKLRVFGAFGGPILLHPSQHRNPIAIADHFACWYIWHERQPSGLLEFQPTVTLVTTARAFRAVGGFDTSLDVLEDYDFEQRLREGRSHDGQPMPKLPIAFVAEMPVYHHARGTLWATFAHSWHWGLPVRQAFYIKSGRTRYRYLHNRKLFWINFPAILATRVRAVTRVAWRLSRWKTLYCWPFLLATIAVWALAIVVGTDDNTNTD